MNNDIVGAPVVSVTQNFNFLGNNFLAVNAIAFTAITVILALTILHLKKHCRPMRLGSSKR